MPTPKPTKHRMPTGLTRDGRGQRLWRDLTDRWEFTEAEYRDLENACHTADRIVCLCSMVLRPVERLVFSPKER